MDPQRLMRRRDIDLDRQISNIIRVRDLSVICQSQSFTQDHTWSNQDPSAPLDHGSRISSYMSPPSPHWTSVGNIMALRKSMISRSRPESVDLSCSSPKPIYDSQSSVKKKCGPFQCLKYQFRRSVRRNMVDHPVSLTDSGSVSDESKKKTKSLFRKKTLTSNNNDHNQSSKSNSIRKSLSLLFSKSNRPSKSDPIRIHENERSLKPEHIAESDSNNCSHYSRRNRSYDSMPENSVMRLSIEMNKSYSDSDVLEYASMTSTNPSISSTEERHGKGSESRFSDSESLCNTDQALTSQATSYYGNMSCRSSNNDWKTVVGNVCRSNSKDSAIANSTLSGDGMAGQSNRVSLTSAISTDSSSSSSSCSSSVSDDFHDSSYSSFNDLLLLTHPSYQASSSFTKLPPRWLAVVPSVRPLVIQSNPLDSPNTSEASPCSDCSTETLKPRSQLFRPTRLLSRHSSPSVVGFLSPLLPRTPSSSRRPHSWPGCPSLKICAPQSSRSQDLPEPILSPSSPKVHLLGPLNSSPLLSPYSKLYSLRPPVPRDPPFSGQPSKLIHLFSRPPLPPR